MTAPLSVDHHGWAYPAADDFMWREAKPDGSYQRRHLDAAMTFVTDRRVAIDGGAHVGQFTKPLAALFDHVIAVEPAEDTFACLVANVARFRLLNVEVKQAALGSRVGYVSLALDAKQTARGNTGGRFVVPGGGIPVERIDDWKLPYVGLIKLDVEGSEPDAINGAIETIASCKPIILFEDKEFSRRYGFYPRATQNLLTTMGYTFLQAISHDEIWGPA